MGKPEILVGKSNGLRHSVWGASENMGGDLRRCNFPILFSLFGRCLFFYLDIPCAGRSSTTSNRQILQSREPSDYRHASSKKLFSFCFDRGKTSFISFSDIYQLILRLWLLLLGLSLFSSIREWIFILVRAEVSD